MSRLSSNKLYSLRTMLAEGLKEVGRCIMECRYSGNSLGHWEGSQYKSSADQEADICMRKELQQILDIDMISEEDLSSQSEIRPNWYWLVDPIDGTASFAHGFDGFVCQVALIEYEVPILAGVYAPALDKMFIASRGTGATINGMPIATHSRDSDQSRPKLVDNSPKPNGIAAYVYSKLNCFQYIESGSIGLKICLVAEGNADIFVKDVMVRDWDIAAPHLILSEASGMLTNLSGDPFQYKGSFEKLGIIAAANSKLHDWVKTAVQTYNTPM